jgi:hypothetical protein
MKSRKKNVCILAMIVILCAVIMPVKATIYGYYDFSPDEVAGDWNAGYLTAAEEDTGSFYECEIWWIFDGVMQDGDDYYIDIDYDGVDPGWPNYEAMIMQYRWGSSGGWDEIATFTIFQSDAEWLIDNPTDTDLYLRLIDYTHGGDSTQHTWYFGSEPRLLVYDY